MFRNLSRSVGEGSGSWSSALETRFQLVAHWYFDNPVMQELKVWSSFINLPHRQASYYMSVLPECLLYPLKNPSLSGIFFCITQKHSPLR